MSRHKSALAIAVAFLAFLALKTATGPVATGAALDEPTGLQMRDMLRSAPANLVEVRAELS